MRMSRVSYAGTLSKALFPCGGLRIKTSATIGGAHVRIVIDIGFGNAARKQPSANRS